MIQVALSASASAAVNAAALNDAFASGGLVVLPAGAFNVSADSVAVANLDGLRIQGEAREATTLNFVGAGKGLSFTNVGFLTLKDVTLQGDGSSDQKGLYCNGIKSSEFERLILRDFANHAIHLCGAGALDVAIDRMRVAAPATQISGARAVKLDGGNSQTIKRCYFNGYAVLVDNTSDSLTSDSNIYESASNGIVSSADFKSDHDKFYSITGGRIVIGGNYNATIIAPRNCTIDQVDHSAMTQKKWLHFVAAEAQGSCVWTTSAP